MPANLPPEYVEARERYQAANAPEEKRTALKEMISLLPKHKGTEKMHADLKKRLAKLEKQIQKKPKKGSSHPWEHVEPQGAGQVALVGLPNSGKSSLLDALTNAEPEVADYPFSTFQPTVGMAPHKDIQFQLIDLPPLSEFMEGWAFNLIRQAHGIALLVDLSRPDPVEDVLEALSILEEARIQLVAPRDPMADGDGSPVRKRALLVGAKADAEGGRAALGKLEEAYGAEYPIALSSIISGQGVSDGGIGCALFELLRIVRVYTKKPGQSEPEGAPYVLPVGSTVIDAAKAIHHEFAQKLDYARMWGSAQYDGQRVEQTHVVQDGDVLEIHA